MIMNKILALCMSPDQGGLELYFLKFTMVLFLSKEIKDGFCFLKIGDLFPD